MRTFWVILLVCCSSSLTWAGLVACPGQGSPVVGAESLATINAGGCQVLDKQFTGFTASGGPTQGSDPNSPGLSNILMTGSSPAPGFVVPGTAFDLSVVFGTTGHNWDSTIFPNSSTSSFDYLLTVDPTFVPSNNWVLSGVGLGVGTVTGLVGVSDGVTVTKNMCLGGTGVPANGGSVGCGTLATVQIVITGVPGGSPTYQDFCTLTGVSGNLCAGNSSAASFLFPTTDLIYTSATIQDQVQIFNGNPNNSLAVTVASLTNKFSESGTSTVPEPASLALVGAALSGLGVLKYRRRKS